MKIWEDDRDSETDREKEDEKEHVRGMGRDYKQSNDLYGKENGGTET